MEHELKNRDFDGGASRSSPISTLAECDRTLVQSVREENEILRELIAELIIKNQLLRFQASNTNLMPTTGHCE